MEVFGQKRNQELASTKVNEKKKRNCRGLNKIKKIEKIQKRCTDIWISVTRKSTKNQKKMITKESVSAKTKHIHPV